MFQRVDRRASVRSSGTVVVLRQDLERLPEQEPSHVQKDRLRPARERGRDQDLDVPELDPLVLAEIFSLEIGVDRHLRLTPSTEGRNEIQRHHAAAFAGQGHRIVGELQFHVGSSRRPSRQTAVTPLYAGERRPDCHRRMGTRYSHVRALSLVLSAWPMMGPIPNQPHSRSATVQAGGAVWTAQER